MRISQIVKNKLAIIKNWPFKQKKEKKTLPHVPLTHEFDDPFLRLSDRSGFFFKIIIIIPLLLSATTRTMPFFEDKSLTNDDTQSHIQGLSQGHAKTNVKHKTSPKIRQNCTPVPSGVVSFLHHQCASLLAKCPRHEFLVRKSLKSH